MAALSAERRRKRASVAAHKRHGKPDDDAEVIEARQDLAALRLEEHVRNVLADAPRPTDEQLAHIAALLKAGGAA